MVASVIRGPTSNPLNHSQKALADSTRCSRGEGRMPREDLPGRVERGVARGADPASRERRVPAARATAAPVSPDASRSKDR
jgi:hypothetical protein